MGVRRTAARTGGRRPDFWVRTARQTWCRLPPSTISAAVGQQLHRSLRRPAPAAFDASEGAKLVNSMTMLRLTGINTYTEELRLPAEPPGTGAAAQSCLSGNLQAWEQVGYTQGLVATGWRQMLTASQRAFPDKTFNLALITDNGFPAFLPNGTPVSSPAAAVQQASLVIVTDLAQITAQQFPGQLVIQSNGLEDQGLLDTTTIQLAQQNGTLLAWQTNESELQTGGAACGGTRAMPMVCTSDADYFNLLKLGIFPEGSSGTNPVMAQYLELLPPNVIAFPNAVLQAHNILLPGPTPVTAPAPTPAPTLKPMPASTPAPTGAPKSTSALTLTAEPTSASAPMPVVTPTAALMPK